MREKYQDLSDLSEADQMLKIGEKALLGNRVGFIVKAGTGERFTREIERLFPAVDVTLIGPITEEATAYRCELKPTGRN